MDNYFSHLAQINVNEHVEKKGQFSYLSWPFAVAQLRQVDPTATWEVRRFDGLPYLRSETGYFVEVAVTMQGITLSQVHPVLDGRNQPLLQPSCFDINASIQRALVKAIALHGLGLYIYAGEDLPQGEASAAGAHTAPTPPRPKATVSPIVSGSNASMAQIRYIQRLIAETGTTVAKVTEYFGVSTIEELTSHAASRAIKSLEKNRKAA